MGSPRDLNDIREELLGAAKQLNKALAEGIPEGLTKAIEQWNKVKQTMVKSIMAASLPDVKKMSPEDRQKLIDLYQNVAEGVDKKVITPLIEKNFELKNELKQQATEHLTNVKKDIKRDIEEDVQRFRRGPGASS